MPAPVNSIGVGGGMLQGWPPIPEKNLVFLPQPHIEFIVVTRTQL
jgi:hypothetical protein